MIIKKNTKSLIGYTFSTILNDNIDLMGNKSTTFLYDSEILLMTNSTKNNFYNIITWIYYHKNIAKFSHITIVHNNCKDEESKTLLKNICDYFKIDYFYEEQGSQSLMFNKYQKLSKAKWLICIDEDEYIYLKNNQTINEVLSQYKDEYKLSLTMINFFSSTLLEEVDPIIPIPTIFNYADIYKKSVNDELKVYPALINFKTFVNNNYYHYVYNSKNNDFIFQDLNADVFTAPAAHNSTPINISCIHNPLCIVNKRVKQSYHLTNKRYYYNDGDNTSNTDVFDKDMDIFILHFKYRSLKEYQEKIKYNKFKDVTDAYYQSYVENLLFNIYNNNNFKQCDYLKDLIEPVKEKLFEIYNLLIK